MAISEDRGRRPTRRPYDEQGYITFPDMLSRPRSASSRTRSPSSSKASQVPDDVEMTDKFSFTRSDTGQRHVRRIFNPIAHHQAF